VGQVARLGVHGQRERREPLTRDELRALIADRVAWRAYRHEFGNRMFAALMRVQLAREDFAVARARARELLEQMQTLAAHVRQLRNEGRHARNRARHLRWSSRADARRER